MKIERQGKGGVKKKTERDEKPQREPARSEASDSGNLAATAAMASPASWWAKLSM
jgi:hypothetical protein